MNKNFEEAYQAEVQLNIPDLWNRIESSLPQKTIMPECAAAESVPTYVPVNQEVKGSRPANKTQKKNPYAWIKWASLAAAALLVVMILPAVAVVGLGLLRFSSSDSASAESAEDGAYIYQDAVMENEAAMDMEMPEDAVAETPAMDSMENMFTDSEEWVTESITEGTVAESGKETVSDEAENESVGSASGSVALYGNMIAEEIPATVTGTMTGSERYYYRVTLMFEGEALELAEELFAGTEEYNDGMLEVRVYYDVTLKPELMEKYAVTIYELTPAALGEDALYPCLAAELQVLE